MVVSFPRIIAQLMSLLIMIGIIYVIFYVVIKLPNYRKLDMTFMEAVQINTSLGKIGASKWKE